MMPPYILAALTLIAPTSVTVLANPDVNGHRLPMVPY